MLRADCQPAQVIRASGGMSAGAKLYSPASVALLANSKTASLTGKEAIDFLMEKRTSANMKTERLQVGEH